MENDLVIFHRFHMQKCTFLGKDKIFHPGQKSFVWDKNYFVGNKKHGALIFFLPLYSKKVALCYGFLRFSCCEAKMNADKQKI